MKMRAGIVAFVVAFVLILGALPTMAAQPEVPDIILKGARAFADQGAEAGFKVWLEGSPLLASVDVKTMVKQTEVLQAAYGPCVGYGIIHVVPFTRNCCKVYFELDHKGGPLFVAMLAHRADKKWIVTGKIDMHTDPAQVLPVGMPR
jgi:hypothetical protein